MSEPRRPPNPSSPSCSPTPSNRRQFLGRAAGAALVAPLSLPEGLAGTTEAATGTLARSAGRVRHQANDQVQIAVVGAGGMGSANADTADTVPGARVVAACDLYDGRLERARERWGADLFTTRDYREVLARPDIDAVIVGTPDHWHRQISIDALRAGKAVYCEKPMVHHVAEGADVVAAQRETGGVFQVGSQGLSSLGNEKARELFQQGVIGELNYAEGFWARNSPVGAWQYTIPDDQSTATVDWQRYQEPLDAEHRREYDPLRFFRWRCYRDYGTGVSGDLFVHLFSSLNFVISSNGPRSIIATGGLRYWEDGREVPDVLLGMFDYPESASHPAFNLSLRVNFVDGTSGTTFLRLVGSEGAMDVKWDEVVVYRNAPVPAPDAFTAAAMAESGMGMGYERKRMRPPAEAVWRAEEGYLGAHYDHWQRFIDAVRAGDGSALVEDATFGYRAAAPALLCNDSYFEDRITKWDSENMRVVT